MDSIEIVRCKDCKWYQNGKYLIDTKFCFRLLNDNGTETGYIFPPNGFCSYGERKNEKSE